MRVNFVDLSSQYKEGHCIVKIIDALREARFVGGVEEFENNFSNFIGTKYAVGLGSGLDALILGLRALGVGPGDDVIVPANTFIATAFAVTHLGANVVFADVNPKTYLLDIKEIKKVITPNTKVIIPVHLYGNVCDMDKIMEFSKINNIRVLEDCAQATGAEFDGVKAGAFGDIGIFSFYPTKNLGGCGQGGMLVTDDIDIASKVRSYGNVGRREGSWFIYDNLGYNSRLDTINAIFLNTYLNHLEDWNNKRIKYATLYNSSLDNKFVIKPKKANVLIDHVYHLYEIKLKDKKTRDALKTYLEKNNIGCGLHYPIPCHKQPIYRTYNDIVLPVVEELADTLLSLPMHPNLSEEEVKFVCEKINEFFKRNTS